MPKRKAYALYEKERSGYHDGVIRRRRHALVYLKEYLPQSEQEEDLALLACLGEFLNLLFRFEEVLTDIPVAALWDKEKNYWLMEEELGARLVLYATALTQCTDELLYHNISFSLH
tara:strand:+ start:20770 stop:21117 length:348 start_codon:yes stop_codon:yes gene_type:complete